MRIFVVLLLTLSLNVHAQSFSVNLGGISKDQTLDNSLQLDLILQAQSDANYQAFESGLIDPNGDFKTIDEEMAVHGVAGTTIVIIERGKVTQVKRYGYKDKLHLVATDKDTFYHSASMSKFAAGIVFAEAERLGDLKLKKNIRKYQNDYPKALFSDWIDKTFKGDTEDYPDTINLKRLLGHMGGLDTHGIGTAEDGKDKDFMELLFGGSFCKINPFCNQGVAPIHQPATVYDYSGGGFVVAEQVLEEATGQKYKDYAQTVLLDALGLSRSTFDEADNSMSDLARKCNFVNPLPWIYCKVYQTNVKTAGGFLAHPEDYAKILTLFMNDGVDEDGTQLLSLDTIQKVMTPIHHIDSSKDYCSADSDCPGEEQCFQNACYLYPENADSDSGNKKYYGLGVSLSSSELDDGYPKILSHGGHDPNMGAAQEFRINRETRTGIVIMTNGTTSIDDDYGGLKFADEVLDSYRAVYE